MILFLSYKVIEGKTNLYFFKKKVRTVVAWGQGQAGRDIRELSGGWNAVYFDKTLSYTDLPQICVQQMHTFAKTQRIAHLRFAHLSLCKFYFKKENSKQILKYH